MEIKILRSTKRRKTVSARLQGGYFVIQAPAHMTDAELAPFIAKLQAQWQKRKTHTNLDDQGLEDRAQKLNQIYFGGQLTWHSIRWVTNQGQRWGSCTPLQGTIRISQRLATVPEFVCDYVIIHELAHLLQADHGPQFWALVNRYPLTERARGYLMALGLEEI